MEVFFILCLLTTIALSGLILILRTVYVLTTKGRSALPGRKKPVKVMVVAGSGSSHAVNRDRSAVIVDLLQWTLHCHSKMMVVRQSWDLGVVVSSCKESNHSIPNCNPNFYLYETSLCQHYGISQLFSKRQVGYWQQADAT